MTAATLTLTDFLLARIAEDEAVVVDRECTDWRETAQFNPLRLLAECEAKRLIVESHGPPTICSWDCRRSMCDTLRALAAIYADHPDYRDEWKP